MHVELVSIFTKEEDIKRIVDRIRNYSFDEIEKDSHFEFSVMEKLTDIDLLRKTFQSFELIKSIELRENERKERYYSFNYELKDETYVIIAIVLDMQKPKIINGYHVNRNYKRFEKSLIKNYGHKLV